MCYQQKVIDLCLDLYIIFGWAVENEIGSKWSFEYGFIWKNIAKAKQDSNQIWYLEDILLDSAIQSQKPTTFEFS